jgi:predicted 3-demethylubiquinone-9 3-methyltransferase (glyoxalase superfamily)
MASVQKISPFLMFDSPVEEAAKFYVSDRAAVLSSHKQKTKGNLP